MRREGTAGRRRALLPARRRCGSDQRPAAGTHESAPAPDPVLVPLCEELLPSSASREPREAPAAAPARRPSAAERPAPCPRIKVRRATLRWASFGGPALRRSYEAGS